MSNYDRKQHDTAQPFRYQPVYSDSSAPILAGATLRFFMRGGNPPMLKVSATATIVSGVFTYAPIAADVDTVGGFIAEWEVTYAGGGIETWPTIGYLSVSIQPDLGP